MEPEKGVDNYSGNVRHSQNLINLKGRNGMDINLVLNYSSNIYNNVRSINTLNPTSWVGLGWGLGFGSIICQHNNTISKDDDKYEYISPTGVREKMIQNYLTGKFYVRSDPFLKFQLVVESNLVKGWKVTTTQGKIYKYGDLTEYGADNNRKATWYTFCWEGHYSYTDPILGNSVNYDYKYVGDDGYSGTLQLYGY
jgi:hypothetical protein